MLPRIAASASGRVASRDRANDKLAPSYHKTSGQALLLIWRDYTIPNRGGLMKGISESAEFDSTGRTQAGSSWRRRLGFEGIMILVLRERWQKGRRTARKRPAVGSRLDLMASREASCLIGGVVLRHRCNDYRLRMFTVANGHGDAL